MLFDRGRAGGVLQRVDVGGHGDRRDVVEVEPAGVAPGEEPRHGRAVGRARMRVADLRREELDQPLGGAWAGSAHERGNAGDLPAPGHVEGLRRPLGQRLRPAVVPRLLGGGLLVSHRSRALSHLP